MVQRKRRNDAERGRKVTLAFQAQFPHLSNQIARPHNAWSLLAPKPAIADALEPTSAPFSGSLSTGSMSQIFLNLKGPQRSPRPIWFCG